MKNQYLQLSLLLLVGFLFLAGCGQVRTTDQVTSPAARPLPPPPPPSPPPLAIPDDPLPVPVEEKPFTHTVRWAGETINRISWWYTGSGKNWPAIAEANPNLDPRRMMIGDLIVIPKHLLKTREQMTKEYRTPETVREQLEEITLETKVTAPQTIELFGPIDSAGEKNTSEKSDEILPLESLE
jgi:hypothetical protein